MRVLAGALVVAALPGLASAAEGPARVIVERPVLEVGVEVLRSGARTDTVARGTIVLAGAGAGTFEADLPASDVRPAGRVRVEASGDPEAPGEEIRLEVEAEVARGGPPERIARTVRLRPGAVRLLELARAPGETLIVALSVERGRRPFASYPSGDLRPVLFRIEVQRVLGDRAVPLEDNRLTTFVGQGVEYGFHRAEQDGGEQVRLRLTPVRVDGAVAEIAVEIEGRLPGAEGGLVLARHERLLASRGAASEVTATAGAPPSGYRFRIVPEF